MNCYGQSKGKSEHNYEAVGHSTVIWIVRHEFSQKIDVGDTSDEHSNHNLEEKFPTTLTACLEWNSKSSNCNTSD